MNIYKFEYEGETDWVCAPNIKKARDFYSSTTGINSFEDMVVKKLTKKELENNYILDLNESEPDFDDEDYEGDLTEDDFCNGYLIIESFAEYLKTAKYTDMVATTAF